MSGHTISFGRDLRVPRRGCCIRGATATSHTWRPGEGGDHEGPIVPAVLPFMSTEASEERRGTIGPRAVEPPYTRRRRSDAYGAYASTGPDAACGFPWACLPTPTRAPNEQAAPRRDERKREGRRQSAAPQQNDQRPHTWRGPAPGKVEVDWELDHPNGKADDERSAWHELSPSLPLARGYWLAFHATKMRPVRLLGGLSGSGSDNRDMVEFAVLGRIEVVEIAVLGRYDMVEFAVLGRCDIAEFPVLGRYDVVEVAVLGR